MKGVPTELIFVLIFIVFSVLEGLGRKKKAEGGKGPARVPGRVPGPQRGSAQTGEASGLPGEMAGAEVTATLEEPSSPGPDTSEGMIPEDVWAEILGLARGTRPEPKEPTKVEEAPEPVEETSWGAYKNQEEAPAVEAVSRPLPEPPVQRSLARVTRVQPQASAPSASPPQKGPGAEGGSVRKELFSDGSAKELRRAVILKEVLGPPVGMRK